MGEATANRNVMGVGRVHAPVMQSGKRTLDAEGIRGNIWKNEQRMICSLLSRE